MNTTTRKEQLINLTIEVIGNYGLSGFTTARLAQSAGLTEAAIYKHFSSKNDIMQATIDTIGKRLHKTLTTFKELDEPAHLKLKRIFYTHLEHIQKNTGIPKIIYSPESHSNSAIREKLYDIISKYLQIIKQIVASGQKEGSISKTIKPTDAARHFMALIQFTAFRYSLSGYEKKIIKEGKELWSSFLIVIKENNI